MSKDKAPDPIVYIVQPGDTLPVIIDRVYDPEDRPAIAEVFVENIRNGMIDPDSLRVGQLIELP